MRSKLKRSLLAVGLVLALALVASAYFYPAIAATACPSCYGLQRLSPTLIIDPELSDAQRQTLDAAIDTAATSMRAHYGDFDHQPILLACASEACDRRLGGLGPRAMVFSTPLATIIRVSPRGLNATILTHEFAHVALHRKIGLWKLLSGTVPAWFDEGVAVVLSNDARYLNPGSRASERCLDRPAVPLPSRAADWNIQAGKTPMIYADAACQVLHWLEAHGDQAGLLQALEDIVAGGTLDLSPL